MSVNIKKGISLVALIITIIVLVNLLGIITDAESITLIITIIVLVILTGTIVMFALKENGIIARAKLAKEKFIVSETKEKIVVLIGDWKILSATGDSKTLKEYLEEKLEVRITETDGSLSFNYNECSCQVLANGNVNVIYIGDGVWNWIDITHEVTLIVGFAHIKDNKLVLSSYTGSQYAKIENPVEGTKYKITTKFASTGAAAVVYEYNDNSVEYFDPKEPVQNSVVYDYKDKEIIVPSNCKAIYINRNKNSSQLFNIMQYKNEKLQLPEVVNNEGWVNIAITNVGFAHIKDNSVQFSSYSGAKYAKIQNPVEGTKYRITTRFASTGAAAILYEYNNNNVEYVEAVDTNTYKYIDKEIVAPKDCKNIYINSTSGAELVINQSMEKSKIYERGVALMNSAPSFAYKTLDKAYISFVFDDTRSDIGAILELFESKGLPACFATVPSKLNDTIQYNGTSKTAQQVLLTAQNEGCEILSHNGAFLTLLDKENYDKQYDIFVNSKNTLEEAGFNINGIILSGGTTTVDGVKYASNASAIRPYNEAWRRQYYKYSDSYGTKEPYLHTRKALGVSDESKDGYQNAKGMIDTAVANKTWLTTMCHGYIGTSTNGITGKGQRTLYDLTYDELNRVLDYIKSLGTDKIEVVTYNTFYNKFKPQ